MSLLKSTSIELMSMMLERLGKTGKHRIPRSGFQEGGKLKSRESTGLSWESGEQREHTKKIGYDSAALSTVESGHQPGLSGQVL